MFSVSVDLCRAFSLGRQCHVLWWCFVAFFVLFCATCTEVTAFFVCLCFEQLVLSTSQVSIASSVTYVSVLSPVSHTSQYCRQCHIRLSIATSTTCIQLSIAASVTCIQLSIAASVTYIQLIIATSVTYVSVLTPVSHMSQYCH